MSGRTDRRIRKLVRQKVKADYEEFFTAICKYEFNYRLRIAWMILRGKPITRRTK